MRTLKHYAYGAGAALLGLATPAIALAANPFESGKGLLSNVAEKAEITTAGPEQIVGGILNAVLGVLGILLLVYLLWGGFKWMTSGGKEEGVDQAKLMIRNAIIGLIIIVAAYAISSYVIEALISVTQG